MMRTIYGAISLIMIFLGHVWGKETMLRIAAASDLVHCLPQINDAFSKQYTHISLQVIYGASGNFSAQIANHAPFDIFLSADKRYPEFLIERKFASAKHLTVYGTGSLVLWTKKPSLAWEPTLHFLTNAEINKVAMANPSHAPYGRLAQEALQKAGVEPLLKAKIVYGDSVAQAAQFVQTGHAEIGLIAKALALSPQLQKEGRFFPVDKKYYTPLEQAAVITLRSQSNPSAPLYLQFLTSSEAQAIFAKFGLALKPSDAL